MLKQFKMMLSAEKLWTVQDVQNVQNRGATAVKGPDRPGFLLP